MRRDGVAVDPFVAGLWSAQVAARLAYRSTQVIDLDFATGPVDDAAIDAGPARPDARSAALVAYVRAIGLKRGDVQRLSLFDPAGGVAASQEIPALDHDKAQFLLFTGKRNSAGRLAPGAWRARYQVERDGRPILARSADFVIP